MNLILRRSLIFISLLLGGLVLYALWYGIKADRYEETAVPYLQTALPILASWQYERLEPLLSPAARIDFDNEKVRAGYRRLGRLGKLQSVGKPQYVTDRFDGSEQLGDVEVVEYNVPLQFDSGPAVIKITLLADGNAYYVHRFGIHSEIFAEGD
jgi:nitrogen fixation-related uncharacterized protein